MIPPSPLPKHFRDRLSTTNLLHKVFYYQMSVEEADAEKSSETPPQFWSYVKQIQIGIVWWENPSLALIQVPRVYIIILSFIQYIYGLALILY